MDMPMDMMPVNTNPVKMQAVEPENIEDLQPTGKTKQETGQQNPAFDLILTELLAAMVLPHQPHNYQTTTDRQDCATSPQSEMTLPNHDMNMPAAAATERSIPDAPQGAKSQSAEKYNALETFFSEASSLQHAKSKNAGNTLGGDVSPAPIETEGAEGPIVDTASVEPLKASTKDRQATDAEALAFFDEHDEGMLQVKVSALQELHKAVEDAAMHENNDRGFQRYGDAATETSGIGLTPEPVSAATWSKEGPPTMQAEPASGAPANRLHSVSEAMRIEGHKFVITRHDGTSIEISLQPEGLGKLDIELILEKGTLHAQIQASHAAGKELVEQNLSEMMNALAREGITIGGFSVSLKQERASGADDKNLSRDEAEKEGPLLSAGRISGRSTGEGMVSIFV